MTPHHAVDAIRVALLVSSVNNGGVFHVAGDAVERLSRIDTTGLALAPGGVVWARQAREIADLRLLRDGTVASISLAAGSLDLHDVVVDGDRMFVVATEINAILQLDAATFVEVRRWTLPGEADSQHVNSVCVHEGRVLATRFGVFDLHRGYKDRTRGAGEIFDVDTGEVLVTGLSQPHSLRSFDGLLWVCDSQAQTLRAYRDFEQVVEADLGAYARGLAFDDTHVHVGLSRGRNDPDSALQSARIVVLDRAYLRVRKTIELPVDEIYDLLPFSGSLPALRKAALAESFAEIGRLSDLVNDGAREGHVLHERAEGLSAALQTAEQRRDDYAKLAGELAASLSDVRGQHAAATIVVDEGAIWTALLESEVERVHTILENHDQVVARQRAVLEALEPAMRAQLDDAARREREIARLTDALAQRDRFITSITASRSWRWTRRLRRQEPERPGPVASSEHHADPAIDDHLPSLTAAADVASSAGTMLSAVCSLRDTAESEFLPADIEARPRRSMVPILGLAFDEHESPEVSIVVTAYGNFAQTLECVRAIRDAGDRATFEVVVIEDASGDEEMARFASVPGLRYHANAENLGFLRSANQAVALSRGAFVHLLNNDTQVKPGWLDALLGTFDTFHDCGMAGSMLVYPDGILQEAGGIVWSDGDACNVGRGGDPADLRYASVREVDYVSGASLLIRGDLLHHLGGFDERYLPAYYEDTDLAFRVRESGYRVYVQPRSVVVHHEGLSHGTDIHTGVKAGQASNRLVFLERWRELLQRDQLAPGEHLFLASDRSQRRKTVLIVDRYAPRTDRDAGSRAIWQLMRVLTLQGMSIKFWPHEGGIDSEYAPMLLSHGIDIVPHSDDDSFEAWIAANGCYVDVVILSRPLVAIDYIDAVRTYCAVPVLFYGHDIHHLRFLAQHRLEPDAQLDGFAHHTRLIEEALWRACDLTLYPAEGETSYVSSWLRDNGVSASAETIPLFAYELGDEEIGTGLSDRRLVLFVGGFAHAPNADGAAWFVRDIWPTIRHHHPHHVLCIVGTDPPPDIIALRAPDIWVTGHIPESGLQEFYRSARVVVAPLRFGAGVKGKVIEALRCGVPCVTTTTGAQGLIDADFLRVADEPADFARLVIDLIRMDEEWMRAATRGYEYVRLHFSIDAVWKVLATQIDAAPYPSVAARRQRVQALLANLAVHVDPGEPAAPAVHNPRDVIGPKDSSDASTGG